MPATSPLPPHLRAAAVAALSAPFRCSGDAAGLPTRIKILNWGENPVRPGGDKKILVDDSVAATLTANQEIVGVDAVPMDYEHQSFPGHKNFKADPRHSPGSGRIEVVPGEGVFLCAIEYTPNGVEHAASYRDVSAVVHHDAQGRPMWISSVALTQTGAVAGVEFAQALSLQSPPTPMEDNQDENTFRDLLIKFLGIKPTAESGGEITVEEIIAAATAKMETMPEEKGEGKGATAETPVGTEALSARLGVLETLEARREREALVARAGVEGKVIPLTAELIAQTPVAILSAMIDGLAAGEVPLSTTQKAEKPGEKTIALSADETHAARALGLTPEEFRNANPTA